MNRQKEIVEAIDLRETTFVRLLVVVKEYPEWLIRWIKAPSPYTLDRSHAGAAAVLPTRRAWVAGSIT